MAAVENGAAGDDDADPITFGLSTESILIVQFEIVLVCNPVVRVGVFVLADDLDQTAYELDGQPQTLGQWWDGLWTGDNNSGSDRDEDFEDWWEDLWD